MQVILAFSPLPSARWHVLWAQVAVGIAWARDGLVPGVFPIRYRYYCRPLRCHLQHRRRRSSRHRRLDTAASVEVSAERRLQQRHVFSLYQMK